MQREAKAAKELMKATVSRIRIEEETKRGLIIVHATYGRASSQSSYAAAREGEMENPVDSEIIDVTVQLQVLVKDSKLFLHESPKVISKFSKISFFKEEKISVFSLTKIMAVTGSCSQLLIDLMKDEQ